MMNDAISRTALLRKTRPVPNLVVKRFGDEWQVEMVTLEDIVDAPALDVAQVVHARWEMVDREAFWIGDDEIWKETGRPTIRKMPVCSICKTQFGTGALEYNYCPNCGARMDGEENAAD